ncbi:protein javelin isoform X3 [Sitodiplosis mosellana]|uniref:protein javelin isoform X3 n=1 Tax=Sitodiplosis mosellana TaxID=263140 RepID=UPI0024449275|nr:protein javelin isoform X3 [Sitodiplosis mosellana]
MGYMQGSQTRSKYKNTDSAQNHVDRVRVPDSNCQFGGPGRGSGWRHRSLSNIDLTSQSKHSFTKQTKGYTSSLYDLYSRLEARKDKNDLENLYGNTNVNSAEKVESIYDRIEQTLDTINKSESCSLRRTRSLAVIREETFNDLQIGGGIRSRRSQLIPRAKLLNRSFFQNRNSSTNNSNNNNNNNNTNNIISRKKYRGEDDSGSGVDTQTSETRESDDYCGNLKKLQGSQIIQKGDQKLLPALWVNDKSDLDSLDSDYFKNSLHQLDGSGIYSAYEGNGKDPYTGRVIGTPDISVQNGYIDDNLSLRSDTQEQSPLPDYCTIKTDEIYSNNKFVSAEDVSVIHVNGGVDTNTFKAKRSNGPLIICENEQAENRRISDIVSIDEIESDRKPKFREDHKSVISYDSIYLSSEGSNEAATIVEEEEKINEYLSDNNYSTLSEYMNTKKDIKPTVAAAIATTTEPIAKDDGDNLYSQINKIPLAKSNEGGGETKTKLTTFSDISNRGTLERLTFISSGSASHNEVNKKVEKPTVAREAAIENQYCSLPLANISRSLQASERIDAKLRLSCYPLEEQTKIYDSITNFGRAHKKLRQRESYEPSPPNPIPIEKEAKSKEPIFIEFTIQNNNTNNNTNINTANHKNIRNHHVSNPIGDVVAAATKTNSTANITDADDLSHLVKIDEEESVSLFSAELNEVENLSSKNCEIDEIREKPRNISLPAHSKPIEYSSSPDIQISRDRTIEETVDVPAVKVNRNGHKSYQKSHYSKRQHYGKSGERYGDSRDRLNANLKVNLSNTLKRRLESKTKHNLNEKLTRNIDKPKHHRNPRVQQAIIENIKTHIVQPNFNMSRPQIMHVIDSKRNLPKSALKNSKENKENEMINVNTTVTGQAKHEMLRKVDSVRSYWSKLIDTAEDDDDKVDGVVEKTTENPTNKHTKTIAKAKAKAKPKANTCIGVNSTNSTLNRIVDMSKSTKSGTNVEEMVLKPPTISVSNNTLRRAASAASGLHSLLYTDRDELNSYTPSVEIVELDDQKQAAIVKVQGVDAEDFDHVRYKVMKTDTFQKNLLNQTRKEPPLDGLLQYLNDYRFQELLTQNNVVIIEPVRTKIEPISSKSHESQLLTCKVTAGAGKSSDGGKGGLRKHFFYHPIRVNKELIDEELPTPDTVRKAKKLFEETLLLCPMKAQKSRSMIGLNENCKSIDRKYLTLETFNNGPTKSNGKHSLNSSGVIYSATGNVCNRIKKWDSSSLSSGISSGDLSSPCDCNDNDDTKMMSNENANELCESYYVSQDILEKIRECGSSVTYYGGRVLNNQSPEVSPMTKAIMREIHSDNNICEVCHPNNALHANRLYTSFCDADKNHLGMKLRLIKSNSCNSRLELAGTRFNDGPLHKFCSRNRSISNTEDTVRNIIQRIETNAIQDKRVPRIIESKCIEKAAADASKPKSHAAYRKEDLTGLSKSMDRLGPMEILSQVSVKNHINAIGMKAHSSSNISAKPSKEILLPRNKDVDLALHMNIKANKEKDKVKSASRKESFNGKNGGDGGEIRSGKTTATVRPTSMLTKAELDERQLLKENHKAILEDLCKAVARSEEEKSKKNNLVKWDSLEKNYFANDMALKRKPKYDDIEFEEFEVIEPKK